MAVSSYSMFNNPIEGTAYGNRYDYEEQLERMRDLTAEGAQLTSAHRKRQGSDFLRGGPDIAMTRFALKKGENFGNGNLLHILYDLSLQHNERTQRQQWTQVVDNQPVLQVSDNYKRDVINAIDPYSIVSDNKFIGNNFEYSMNRRVEENYFDDFEDEYGSNVSGPKDKAGLGVSAQLAFQNPWGPTGKLWAMFGEGRHRGNVSIGDNKYNYRDDFVAQEFVSKKRPKGIEIFM